MMYPQAEAQKARREQRQDDEPGQTLCRELGQRGCGTDGIIVVPKEMVLPDGWSLPS